MSLKFDNEKAIYLQIVDIIKMDIISGKYKAGDKLPSVRDLALQFRVNPNTMQRALVQLEDEKLLYTERTNGRYVSDEISRVEEEKQALIKMKIEECFNYLRTLGLNDEEIMIQIGKIGKGE